MKPREYSQAGTCVHPTMNQVSARVLISPARALSPPGSPRRTHSGPPLFDWGLDSLIRASTALGLLQYGTGNPGTGGQDPQLASRGPRGVRNGAGHLSSPDPTLAGILSSLPDSM